MYAQQRSAQERPDERAPPPGAICPQISTLPRGHRTLADSEVGLGLAGILRSGPRLGKWDRFDSGTYRAKALRAAAADDRATTTGSTPRSMAMAAPTNDTNPGSL